MIDWFREQKDAWDSRQRIASKEKMPEASDNGSQPYSRAFRHSEMAGARIAHIISACPWVGDMVSVCPLPNGKVSDVGALYPAIYFPSLREQWPLVRGA